MTQWLLLVYKIPREPTAGRVYVWRKLKQLGAVALQDAVWVLPSSPRTQEQFQWLAAEIAELGGEVHVWEARQLYATNQVLTQKFIEPVETEYREILAALKRKDRDLGALSKRYQQTSARDYFQSELGRQLRKRLLAAEGGRKR
ncbi:MAG: ChrB protein [Planctomycetaceae bacterium]|nr:ChrB protein [Planctomycetaceae bacterium]